MIDLPVPTFLFCQESVVECLGMSESRDRHMISPAWLSNYAPIRLSDTPDSLLLYMFENSFLVRPEISCELHPKQKITIVCTDLQCSCAPLLCPSCLGEFDIKNKHLYHQSSVKGSWEGFNVLAALADRDRATVDRLYRKICTKENEQLIKWQEDRKRHFESIEKHLNSLRYQLDEEIRGVIRLFEVAVEEVRKQLFSSLDTYLKTYKENFEIFAKLIEPLVVYGRSNKYYSNVNNITLKLLTEPKKKAGEWLIDFKSTLGSIQRISAGVVPFQESLDRATTYMNAMIDSLPNTEFHQEKIAKAAKAAASEIFKGTLLVEDLKSLNLILGFSQPQLEERRLGKKVSIFDPAKKK